MSSQPGEPPFEKPLGLRDYLRIIWRRRLLVLLAVAVAGGSAFGLSNRKLPTYVATAKIFLGPRTIQTGDLSTALEELYFSAQFVASYAELLKSRPLAERVVEKEDLPFTPAELASMVQTSVISDTRIIQVSMTDTNPDRAAIAINGIVETFVTEDIKDYGGRAGLEAFVLEPALVPTIAIGPFPIRDGLFGGALGLALGIGAAFLLAQLDTTLRTRQDAEEALAPLPILAAIPTAAPTNGKGSELYFKRDARSPGAESFRILRTNVQFFSVDSPVRTILITSPSAEDGKTTVAANLATSMALAGYKTLLVESDLRRPLVNSFFGFANVTGLSEILLGNADLAGATQATPVPNLSVLPSGMLPPNPAELLGTERMSDVMVEARKVWDMVILDSPPTLAVADASVLGQYADGVVLVVRSGKTNKERARAAMDLFSRLGMRVLGAVLNDVDTQDAYYYYRYYHGYFPDGRKARKKSKKQQESWPPPVEPLRERSGNGSVPPEVPEAVEEPFAAVEEPLVEEPETPSPQPWKKSIQQLYDEVDEAEREFSRKLHPGLASLEEPPITPKKPRGRKVRRRPPNGPQPPPEDPPSDSDDRPGDSF